MTLRAVKASAPGSLMLMGEHAVLRGQPAIVCAISKRMKIKLKPRADRTLVADDLEVAVLSRTNGRRCFRRLTDEAVAEALAG